jgi:diguanylate cyclase (GGDEF)-like protein
MPKYRGFVRAMRCTLSFERLSERVLVKIAPRVQVAIGPNRKLYRVGDRAFAVILPGSCAESATLLAERLRQTLATPHEPSAGLPRLTASFGVAEPDRDLTRREAWLKCADMRLVPPRTRDRTASPTIATTRS